MINFEGKPIWRYGQEEWAVENNIIIKRKNTIDWFLSNRIEYENRITNLSFKDYISKKTGYTGKTLKTYREIISSAEGLPFCYLIEIFKQKDKINPSNGYIQKDWEELRSRFDGEVIGIYKESLDVVQAGFSIRVLLSATTPKEDRKAFVKTNYKEILLWLMEDIQKTPSIRRKIGDIKFYKPTEIVLLKVPQIEIKFETKVA